MSFFLRYVIVYIAVALGLLGLVAYSGFEAGLAGSTWIVIAIFAVWMLFYHPLVFWLDYRRIRRLIADLRAGLFDHQIDPRNIRESITYLASRYGGVPEIIAAHAVRRVVTDDVARQIAARLRERTGNSPHSA